jgi:membrane carboxypeptidase/penicillin-binding protein
MQDGDPNLWPTPGSSASPDVIAAVWVGFDSKEVLKGETGGRAASIKLDYAKIAWR